MMVVVGRGDFTWGGWLAGLVLWYWAGPWVGVLPRQLAHHFQQSLVLLLELLVFIFDVIKVLQKTKCRQLHVSSVWAMWDA